MKKQVMTKRLSVYYLMALLLNISCVYTMEKHEGYKIIETMQIPGALTLAINASNIVVGTIGRTKLYDIKGKSKSEDIFFSGNGGLVFETDNDAFIGVSRKGQFYQHLLKSDRLRYVHDTQIITYSTAYCKNKLFFGSNDNTVHVLDLANIDHKDIKSCIKTYTGKETGQINTLQVTDKAILKAGSNGHLVSIDRETKSIIWDHPKNVPLLGLAKENSLYYAGYKDGLLVIGDPDKHFYDRVNLRTYLYSLACSKLGYLVVGHIGKIDIYDIRKIAVPLMELALQNKQSIVTELEATENGFVAITDHNTVQVWEEAQ